MGGTADVRREHPSHNRGRVAGEGVIPKHGMRSGGVITELDQAGSEPCVLHGIIVELNVSATSSVARPMTSTP